MTERLINLTPIFVVIAITGCSRYPEAPAFPEIDPVDAAAQAIIHYDKNGDNQLSASELSGSPSLAASMKRIDKNQDGAITAEEIEKRLRDWLDSGTSLVGAMVMVTLNGEPLVDAEIVVEPETFLGKAYKTARATTDETGMATFEGHDPELPGLHLGFYRVRVSKLGENGKEQLPEKYNTDTELGVEIAGDKSNLALFALVTN